MRLQGKFEIDHSGLGVKLGSSNSKDWALVYWWYSEWLNSILMENGGIATYCHCVTRTGNHRGSQRAAVEWRLHKLVMAVNRAYLMSESTVDSKCSNNSPEIPLRTKESRSNDKETSIKVLSGVLGPAFPRKFERLFDRFGSAIHSTAAGWEPLCGQQPLRDPKTHATATDEYITRPVRLVCFFYDSWIQYTIRTTRTDGQVSLTSRYKSWVLDILEPPRKLQVRHNFGSSSGRWRSAF